MKIIILSKKDFACSGLKYRNAINNCSKNKNKVIICKIIIYEPNKFANECDYDYIVTKSNKDIIQKEISSADIIHFKGDDLPDKYWYNFVLPDVPFIITCGGSGFRRNQNKSKVSLEWFPIEKYLECSNFRTVLTPDLNYPEFHSNYIQQCIDSENKPYLWKSRKIPIIAHSPSNREKKGTNAFILPALEILKNEGHKFDLDIIENVSNSDCIERKKNATIFIDQISDTGFYGISALEAMQFGIPVVSYISEIAKIQSEHKISKFSCPVIQVQKSVFSLYEELKILLNSNLKNLSIATKTFCDKFHSYNTVGNLLFDFYKNIYTCKMKIDFKSINYWDSKVKKNPFDPEKTLKISWSSRKDKSEIQCLANFIKKYNFKNIIDIGSGTGIIFWFLKTNEHLNNINFKMVDFSEKLRFLCKNLTGTLPDYWNGIELNYKNNEFDLAISHSVLLHVEPSRIKKFFIENFRVCKYMFIATYNGTDINLSEHNYSHDYKKIFSENNAEIIEEFISDVPNRIIWLLKKK